MDKIRGQLLYNELSLPSFDKFVSAIGEDKADEANNFFMAAWHAYLRNKKPISLTYWADRFNDAKAFNVVLMSLARSGWIETHSIPERNWAEAKMREEKLLEYVTQDELDQIRIRYKFARYKLNDDVSRATSKTRVNNRVKHTGLIRRGFQKAGNTRFMYAVEPMIEYKEAIGLNLTKSMDKIAEQCPNLRADKAGYDTISMKILEDHIENSEQVFTRGNNHNDSRGRAISASLGKVANPISCKDFRALLVIPEA